VTIIEAAVSRVNLSKLQAVKVVDKKPADEKVSRANNKGGNNVVRVGNRAEATLTIKTIVNLTRIKGEPDNGCV
jgi:hypothetical protein